MKSIILACLLFLLSSFDCYCGDLLANLKTTGLAAINNGQYKTADSILRKGIWLAQKNGNLKMEAFFTGNLGLCFDKQGNLNEALRYYNQSKAIAIAINDSLPVAINLLNIGIILKNQGNYIPALENLMAASTWLEGLALRDKNPQQRALTLGDLASAYGTIATIHDLLQDTSISYGYHKKALTIWQKVGNAEDIARSLNRLGEFFLQQQKYDSSFFYFNQALAIKLRLKKSSLIASTLINLGVISDSLHRKADAKNLFMNAYYLQKKVQDSTGLAHSCVKIANCFLENKDIDSALFYVNIGMPIALRFKLLPDLCEYYNIRKEIYRQMHEPEKALSDYDNYLLIKDKLSGEKVGKHLTHTVIRFEREKNNRELGFSKERENRQKNLNKILLIGSLLLTALLISATSLLHSNRKKKTKIEALHRELNHRVKNNLQMLYSLIGLQKDTIESDEAKALLEENRLRIQSMMLIHSRMYSGESITNISMGQYLEELIHEFVAAGTSNKEVVIEKNIEPHFIETDKAIILGLVANEVLSNVFKHAFPSVAQPLLKVTFAKDTKGLFTLTISDNGPGADFTLIAKKNTFGLKLINTLCRQLKARYSFHTNKGTVFSFSFKVN